MKKFNDFTPNLRFKYESNEKDISFLFLDLVVTLLESWKLWSPTATSTCITPSHTHNILGAQLFSAKH